MSANWRNMGLMYPFLRNSIFVLWDYSKFKRNLSCLRAWRKCMNGIVMTKVFLIQIPAIPRLLCQAWKEGCQTAAWYYCRPLAEHRYTNLHQHQQHVTVVSLSNSASSLGWDAWRLSWCPGCWPGWAWLLLPVSTVKSSQCLELKNLIQNWWVYQADSGRK